MPRWLGEYDLPASALASGTTGVPSECSTYPKAQAFKRVRGSVYMERYAYWDLWRVKAPERLTWKRLLNPLLTVSLTPSI